MSCNLKKTVVFVLLTMCFQGTFGSCKSNMQVKSETTIPAASDWEKGGEEDNVPWSQKEFVLSTFFALPGSGNANQYWSILTQTKNAGINLVELPFIQPEALFVALNIAEELGIRTLAQNRQIYSGIGGDAPPVSETNIVNEVKFLKRFKMLEGYYVWDEPYERNFETVKSLNKLLKKHDPDRLAFSTLYPSYGVYSWQEGEYNWESNTYAQYVTKYLQQTNPAVLSFNYYPFRDNKENTNLIQNDLWRDFGYIRRKAIEYNKPLWYYFQAVSIDPNNPGVMNLERIRAQMYAALAYGVKGLSYYTTYGSLLTETFEKSALYDDLAVLNKSVKNIGNLLLEAKPDKLYHTGINSNLQGAYFLDRYSDNGLITEAPDNLIIGVQRKGNTKYIIVSNKSHTDNVFGKIKLNRRYKVSAYNLQSDKVSGSSMSSEMLLSLVPGGIAVYLIDK